MVQIISLKNLREQENELHLSQLYLVSEYTQAFN